MMTFLLVTTAAREDLIDSMMLLFRSVCFIMHYLFDLSLLLLKHVNGSTKSTFGFLPCGLLATEVRDFTYFSLKP